MLKLSHKTVERSRGCRSWRFTGVQQNTSIGCTTQDLQFDGLPTSSRQLLAQTLDRSGLSPVCGDDQITFLQACRSRGAWNNDALHEQTDHVRQTGGAANLPGTMRGCQRRTNPACGVVEVLRGNRTKAEQQDAQQRGQLFTLLHV